MTEFIRQPETQAAPSAEKNKLSTTGRSLICSAVFSISIFALTGCEDDTYEPETTRPIPVPGEVIVDEDPIDQYIEDQQSQTQEVEDQSAVRDTQMPYNKLQPEFIELDKDSNGTISVGEWPLDQSFAFTSADLDEDGQVSRSEFLASYSEEALSE
ncbi:MAG: hypothetical protein NXH95_08335 [Pseudomonadaceae bacterium]|nr:hypothetical protein [Pseudomonadaceae bacterium]